MIDGSMILLQKTFTVEFSHDDPLLYVPVLHCLVLSFDVTLLLFTHVTREILIHSSMLCMATFSDFIMF